MSNYHVSALRKAEQACKEAADSLERLVKELETEKDKVRRLTSQTENMGRRIKNLDGISEEIKRLKEENANLKAITDTL